MTKKTVWILNHYATNQYHQKGGRHYWFARKLQQRGYDPTIFAASTQHGRHQSDVRGVHQRDEVKFHFLRTPRYKSKIGRLRNVITFYLKLLKLRNWAGQKPDVIYASSVHPLTLLAGIQIARHFDIPCVCEVRDLWPLSIEVFEPRLRNSLITRLLYVGEQQLYRHADQLVFTMPGGAEYISRMGWSDSIDLRKVHYINNGIDTDSFATLAATPTKAATKLRETNAFTVAYTGSIRKVNNVGAIVEVARILHERGRDDIRLFIFGSGDEREHLERSASQLSNISFEGFVPKQDVPSILDAADALVFHGDQGVLAQFGTSMNKMAEYLASGTPIVSDCRYGFDPIEANDCGYVFPSGTPDQLADALIELKALPNAEYAAMSTRARIAAREYDFGLLTDKLVNVLDSATTRSSASTVRQSSGQTRSVPRRS